MGGGGKRESTLKKKTPWSTREPPYNQVHRFTHRVVRGSLLICGRPDGRLSALTTLEQSVCLSVNQASSIQNYGVTCESITVGHNASKLPLTADAVVLKGKRPRFLCEQLLAESGVKVDEGVSSGALLGEYANLKARAKSQQSQTDAHRLPYTVEEKFEAFVRQPTMKAATRRQLSATYNSKSSSKSNSGAGAGDARNLRGSKSKEGDEVGSNAAAGGVGMCVDEFMLAYRQHGSMRDRLDDEGLAKLFADAISSSLDVVSSSEDGRLTFDEFTKIAEMSEVDVLRTLNRTTRNVGGLVNVEPSREKFFGERLRRESADLDGFDLVVTQNMSMQLYERRIASLQRFVVRRRGHTYSWELLLVFVNLNL